MYYTDSHLVPLYICIFIFVFKICQTRKNIQPYWTCVITYIYLFCHWTHCSYCLCNAQMSTCRTGRTILLVALTYSSVCVCVCVCLCVCVFNYPPLLCPGVVWINGLYRTVGAQSMDRCAPNNHSKPRTLEECYIPEHLVEGFVGLLFLSLACSFTLWLLFSLFSYSLILILSLTHSFYFSLSCSVSLSLSLSLSLGSVGFFGRAESIV